MNSLAVPLFIVIISYAGPVYGLVALIAMLRRDPRSRLRGVISVICVVMAVLTVWAASRQPPSLEDLYIFSLFAIPGALAIIFVRPPRLQSGHCKTCGYNLTGNVSGKCSECGTATANSD